MCHVSVMGVFGIYGLGHWNYGLVHCNIGHYDLGLCHTHLDPVLDLDGMYSVTIKTDPIGVIPDWVVSSLSEWQIGRSSQ